MCACRVYVIDGVLRHVDTILCICMRDSKRASASHRANVFVYLVCSGSRSRVHIELRYFNDVIYNNRLGNSENLFTVCLFRWFVFWYVSKRFPIINIEIIESISIYSARFQYTFNPKIPPKISIRMSRLWYTMSSEETSENQ